MKLNLKLLVMALVLSTVSLSAKASSLDFADRQAQVLIEQEVLILQGIASGEIDVAACMFFVESFYRLLKNAGYTAEAIGQGSAQLKSYRPTLTYANCNYQ